MLQEVSSGSVRASPTDVGIKSQILFVAYKLWRDAALTGSPVSGLAIAPLALLAHSVRLAWRRVSACLLLLLSPP